MRPHRHSVLVIDDDTDILDAFTLSLTLADVIAHAVSSGREAINLLERGLRPCALLLDIRMPGMDGVEVLQRILDHNRTMPVILNTAYSSYKDNFMTWAADAYVVKSSDVTELIAKIRDVLSKRKGESDARPGQGAAGA